MNENNKPEWFEIAENDGPTAIPREAKTLPVLAVIATALILGVGAVVAQVQNNSPTSAVDAANVQTEATNNTTSATSQAPMTDPSAGSTASSTSGLKNPSIAQLPTKGDNEDDDDDEEDDEEDDD